MAQLVIHDLDDAVKERLEQRAARFRRCGLESQIQELRGQQVRPATLRR
jgi:plasmid stability protein